VDIRCDDDAPGCVVEYSFVGHHESAPSALAGTLDLSSRIGLATNVEIVARDSVGQSTGTTLTIFAEDPSRLSIAAEVVGGRIVDADERRLLVYERVYSPFHDRLAIYDRVSGLTEEIPLDVPVASSFARLTPTGAIFASDGREFREFGNLYLWRLGSLTDLGPVQTPATRGSFATWIGSTSGFGSVFRLNTTTGVVTQVSPMADAGPALAADGTIVFEGALASGGTCCALIKDVSGQQTTLAGGASLPATDGNIVVYEQSSATVLLRDGMQTVLSEPHGSFLGPPGAYQVEGGWVAYTDVGSLGQNHIFTLSPEGVVVRHTDFSASSSIDRLAGNGEVMVRNDSSELFFSRGAGTVAVSGSNGRSYFLSGRWFVSIGRSLLLVDTDG
jgi:hypothetical protein